MLPCVDCILLLQGWHELFQLRCPMSPAFRERTVPNESLPHLVRMNEAFSSAPKFHLDSAPSFAADVEQMSSVSLRSHDANAACMQNDRAVREWQIGKAACQTIAGSPPSRVLTELSCLLAHMKTRRWPEASGLALSTACRHP